MPARPGTERKPATGSREVAPVYLRRVTDEPQRPASPSRRRTVLVAAIAFLSLGALVSLYGPLFPVLRSRFGIGVEQVGAVVSAHFVGSLAAVLVSGVLIRRLGYRTVMVGGSVALVAGLAGLVPAPGWTLFLAAAVVAGVGFGLVQVAINLVVARSFPGSAAPALNLINAVFGAGALATPIMVAAFGPRLGPPVYVLTGLAGLVLIAVLSLRTLPVPPAIPRDREPGTWGVVLGFVVLYFAYVSAEVGVTSWSTEHLTPAYGLTFAAAVPGAYWGALTVGRLVAAALTSRFAPGKVLVFGLSVAVAALVGATYVPIAPVMYGVVGFALAPTFATGLAWLTARFPGRAEQVSPAVFAAASVGPIATAPLIGLAFSELGPVAVPTSLAALAAAALLSAVWIQSRGATDR